ncbi:ATP-dependent nuclease [Mixta hanseatica]|uniref:AAA family ATPase n=1 Tax=Mixta hanseatica TaxID=2872648 RepID=A0ABY4R791_9GAMM|nr:AAA family ATPase [Mixta hanseatica]UQY43307.1 AAA family ATPase [Mixta hanseatica]
MKLAALYIKNFKGVNEEIRILIDNVVVLIGKNNSCKSTVLDAYEAYCTLGTGSRSLDDFHNRDDSLPIEITGLFTDVNDHDIKQIGQEWFHEELDGFKKCSKFKIIWDNADNDGRKLSFSNETNDWKDGGAGGWNSILSSRLPTPIRINPNDSHVTLEAIVKDLIASNAVEKIKSDKSKAAGIISEIQSLAKEIEGELLESIQDISSGIEENVDAMFKGVKVRFETGVGKFEPEKAIKEGSRFIFDTNGCSSPLSHQGSGVQRAFLWAAIKTLCNAGLLKKGRKIINNQKAKILLVDEPEINMHPSVVRSVRDAIYTLAGLEGWQVICTTHSPVFIDLTRAHTTLIKVSNVKKSVRYYQTEKVAFTDNEKENLKTLNRCCPTVNEFFFYEKSILVEGDTEFLAYNHIIHTNSKEHEYCVINCRGKANIPTFIKILNQFGSKAVAIHDLDNKFIDGGKINAMWTINKKIREAADLSYGNVITVAHLPDFEGHYLKEKPKKDKPYNIFCHLSAEDYYENEKYRALRNSLNDIEAGTHTGIYEGCDKIDAWGEARIS